MESISGFPSIGMCLTTYYSAYPAIVNQSLTTLFPHLIENMKDNLLKLDPGNPFSGSTQHSSTKQQKQRVATRKRATRPTNPPLVGAHMVPPYSPPHRHPHQPPRLCTLYSRNPAPTGYASGTVPEPLSRRSVWYAGSPPTHHCLLRISTP